MIIWKPLKVLTNTSDKNVVAVILTNSDRKEEVVGYVQYKFPCSIAFWTSLQLGNAPTMEVNMSIIFMDLKRP